MPRNKRDENLSEMFSERLEKALDNNPNAPPKFHGERVWLSDMMKRKGRSVSPETIRKWINGIAMPTHDKVPVLAEILGVDPDWLLYGSQSSELARFRIRHDAYAEAATNLVAGMIEMDGSRAVFPAENRLSNNVHLQAIIDRVSFPLHIVVGETDGKIAEFLVPSKMEDAIPIGVIRRDHEFAYDLFDLTGLTEHSSEIRSGRRVVRAKLSDLKRISNFADRL